MAVSGFVDASENTCQTRVITGCKYNYHLGFSPSIRLGTVWVAFGLMSCATISKESPLPIAEDALSSVPAVSPPDLWDLALSVSGYDTPASKEKARKVLMKRIDRLRLGLPKNADVPQRARALLTSLHGPEGLLQKYNARATTLQEVIQEGEFNCLSASVLFALLAQKEGLDVMGELLPSHARILVRDGKKTYRIETTSPEGFSPSPQVLKRILAQSVGADDFRSRSLVDSRGAQTSPRLLIALIYVNRASIAQEKGELRLAENLFRRGEDLAKKSPMRKILREQRAALLSQLGANDMMSNIPARQLRAFNTMVRSAMLKPEELLIREAVHQNLRAAAERVIANWAMGNRDDDDILGVVQQALEAGLPVSDGGGLRAFAYSEIARKRARKSDYDGALSSMDEAMNQRLAPRDTKLKTSLVQNHVAALRLAAMTSAKGGAYAKSMQIIERLLNLRGISANERREYETYRKQAMLLSAAKSMEDEKFSDAAIIYRTGRRLYPQDQTIKHNLIAALERLSLGKVNRGLCEEIEVLLREIHTLDPTEIFTRPAKIRCLLIRANQRLQNDDYPEAIAWLKSAKRSFPGNNLVRENLIVAYMKWLDFEVTRGACRKLAKIKAEVLRLEGSSVIHIEEITANCVPR